MGRIRTVKPDFFRHEGLQDLEAANPGSYVMLIFEALWCHCDKLGHFRWKPRTLKLDILPFLEYDIDASLALLMEAGFLKKYKIDGEIYGEVVTFEEHQRISGKEAQEAAKYPEPKDYLGKKNRGRKGEAPGKQQGGQEGKGKEGKGKDSMSGEKFFSSLWKQWSPFEMPKGSKREATTEWDRHVLQTGVDPEAVLRAARGYCEKCAETKTKTKHVSRWLKHHGWEDIDEPPEEIYGPNWRPVIHSETGVDKASVGLWQDACCSLVKKHGPATVDAWLCKLVLESVDPNGTFHIRAPSKFHADWVKQHYLADLIERIGDGTEINFVVSGKNQPKTTGSQEHEKTQAA